MTDSRLVNFLNEKVKEYETPGFIPADPISVPHQFSKKADIEIAGFFAAIFAWGNRKTIINKANELMGMMDHSPHDFCLNHSPADLRPLLNFKHRTFNATDLLYFIEFFRQHYFNNSSLESAFLVNTADENTEKALNLFYNYFFSLPDLPSRTLKHIAAPQKQAACKRINMFLRWMVRSNQNGVDFGIWKTIHPGQLVIPLDLHVARVARHFKLLDRKQTDWLAAVELTQTMKSLDARDPARYDYALFALGVLERF